MPSAAHWAFVLIALLAGVPAQHPAYDQDDAWRGVEEAFVTGCKAHGVVGAQLAFVRDGKVAKAACWGLADRDGGRPVDDGTIFHWASCTKTLTGIAVMQLRDRQRLRLDQPIVEFAPELNKAHDPLGALPRVTVRDVMRHAAGLRAGTWPWGGEDWHPHEPTEWSQLVAMMPYTRFESQPGEKYSYSNLGIVLLGRAIEALSGDDYEVYMDKNVLRPLGMAGSYFDVTPYHLQPRRSHGYGAAANGEPQDLGPDFDTGVTVSNGGLNAPVADMARYLAFLLGAAPAGSDAAAVLARASLEEMWAPSLPTGGPADERIGLCFFVQRRNGQPFVGHTGGQHGFVSFFYVHPASGTGALAAFNTASAGPVMQAVRELCMERLSAPLAAPQLQDRAQWGRYGLRVRRDQEGRRLLTLTAPTLGHELQLDRCVTKGGEAEALLRLVTPGRGEIVAQALQELQVELDDAALGDVAALRVKVALWERGASYLVEPAHQEAALLALR